MRRHCSKSDRDNLLKRVVGTLRRGAMRCAGGSISGRMEPSSPLVSISRGETKEADWDPASIADSSTRHAARSARSRASISPLAFLNAVGPAG